MEVINEFIIKKRNLPHWQVPGSVYFITFRTYKGIILDEASKQIIFDNIIYYSNSYYQLYSFVIMPDHVHIILQPKELGNGKYVNLSKIMQAIKGYSAKQIIKHLNEVNDNSAQTGASVLPKVDDSSQTGASVLPTTDEFTQTGTSVLPTTDEFTQTGTSVLPTTDEFTQTGASVLPIKHIFQDESFDRIIRNDEELFEKMNYILNNPAKRGLIENGYAYKWYYLNDK